MRHRTLVLGGGIAGVAAAVAAAAAGDRVVLHERSAVLGGVAVAARHHTLCGLFENDAPEPRLLEPGIATSWLPFLGNGPPLRRGRVWLLPCAPQTLCEGLLRRVQDHGVELRLSCGEDGDAGFDRVIDARGGGPIRAVEQRGAWRSQVRLGEVTRQELLRRIARIHPGSVAIEALPAGWWQLTIDAPAADRAAAERLCLGLGGVEVEHLGFFARDLGGSPGLALAELFANRGRGLCWCSWPCELHHAQGVEWIWPPGTRYGVPEQVTRSAELPRGWRVCGRGLAAQQQAVAALRVTGSALMIGQALGSDPWIC